MTRPATSAPFDAVLLVSFGGPQGLDDIRPFLANVLRGRRVPPDRVEEVARHYERFGGVSPITRLTRQQAAGLQERLDRDGLPLPVYVGMRNWHPFLADTLREMSGAGIRRAVGLILAGFRSWSSCGQYRDNVLAARRELRAAGHPDVEVSYVGDWHAHDRFIEAWAARAAAALDALPASERDRARLVFTAHSIPLSMAHTCDYVAQLREASRLISKQVASDNWEVVFQSRSGPPAQPWLEPDICDRIDSLGSEGLTHVCAVPLGFLSDHVEVAYDLDCEAAARANAAGISFVRAETVGTCPVFVSAVGDLIRERVEDRSERSCIGELPAMPDECPADCCPRPQRPSRAAR
jgi:ferrochelatase